MSINEWISSREIHGRTTFSMSLVREGFPTKSQNSLKVELKRLSDRGRIRSVYNGYYVTIPVEYRLRGVIPPVYYIDGLMQHLGRKYYVCLLSAAAMYGAAHQRPMKTQVMTDGTPLKPSKRNPYIDWNNRKEIPMSLLVPKQGQQGIVWYSSPELTAVDLVQFANHIGGYQRVATVLAELVDSLDIAKIHEVIPYTTITTLQRLGYILEFVLEEKEKSDALYDILKTCKRTNSVLMRSNHFRGAKLEGNRWWVNANIKIEIDDL